MEIYDQSWAASYEQRANAAIPGREGLYRLCRAFLAGLPARARLLVVGCGTGDDLVPLARALPQASFVGIEPAPAMLDLCARRVAAEGLAERVILRPVSLDAFDGDAGFAAATSILVSQHVTPDASAAAFFRRIASLLEPRGLLFSADLHVAAGQSRARMLELWRDQAVFAGIPPADVEGMLGRFASDIRPRDEAVILGFLREAGFVDIAKPFSSLLYGAWAARKAGA